MTDSHHNRFIILPEQAESDEIILNPEETRHIRVKRIQPGIKIWLLDGEGFEAEADVKDINKNKVSCRILSRKRYPLPVHSITLVLGIIRPGPMAYACEKAAELGADRIIPLKCENSQREMSTNEIERLNRIALSAMKQSGRVFKTQIDNPNTLDEILAEIPDEDFVFYADMKGVKITELKVDKSVVLLVGPEGGFTVEETDKLRSRGAIPVKLNPARLRSETAAAAGIAMIVLQINQYVC
ncbi:MAG: 16S rRNA (uracil(1498)-N(3))-methyltransferase [FCB group bacterium]|nr:16S rRNA (uracil(1498)-N(3))-methyltransferase [FCB group bacterium]